MFSKGNWAFDQKDAKVARILVGMSNQKQRVLHSNAIVNFWQQFLKEEFWNILSCFWIFFFVRLFSMILQIWWQLKEQVLMLSSKFGLYSATVKNETKSLVILLLLLLLWTEDFFKKKHIFSQFGSYMSPLWPKEYSCDDQI